MARELPEFAGAHIDSGYLNVLLTDLNSAERAREVVLRELARQGRSLPIRFRRADYSYAQLTAFMAAVAPFGDDVVIVALYEQYNRIYVGLLTDDALDRFEATIRRRGVPRGAFVLKRAEPAVPLRAPAS